MLKGYSRTCGQSCSDIFGIHDSKNTNIKVSDQISFDILNYETKRAKMMNCHHPVIALCQNQGVMR